MPGELIAYGRRMALNYGKSEVLYTIEGRNSSVAITRWNDGAIEIDVNGHVEATTEVYDMKLQRMVGHLPAILHPNAKSILGIGFGAGVSAGTFTRYPNIEHITICEIEPVIPPTSTRYFGAQNYRVYENPKTRVVFDDARHYLMTTNDKFDIIASDPLDVFAKGTAAIYSLEYFESVKRHLNPGGMFTLYVPAVRKRRAHGEKRAGYLPGRVPALHHLGQHGQRPGLRHGVHGTPGAAQDRPRRHRGQDAAARVRAGGAVPARDRRGLAQRPALHLRRAAMPTSASGARGPNSIPTPTCACSTWAAGASTPRWKT